MIIGVFYDTLIDMSLQFRQAVYDEWELLTTTELTDGNVSSKLGLSTDETNEFLAKVYRNNEKMVMREGGKESIQTLTKAGHKIIILGDRKITPSIASYLTDKGYELPHYAWFRSGAKRPLVHAVVGREPSQVADMVEKTLGTKTSYLMGDAPCLDVNGRFVRVEGWSEFMAELVRLEKIIQEHGLDDEEEFFTKSFKGEFL